MLFIKFSILLPISVFLLYLVWAPPRFWEEKNRVRKLVIQFLTDDSRRSYRLYFFALVVIITLITTLLLVMGTCPQRSFWGDPFFQLDGAWRIWNGQVPHLDFSTPVGIVPLLVVALGMLATGVNSAALGSGPAILFPVVALAGWRLARPRLGAFWTFSFSLLVGLTVVGLFPLGEKVVVIDFKGASYAMQYNRMGWAFLLLLFLQLLIPARVASSRGRAIFEGAVCGLLTGLLLYSKIILFSVALVVILFGNLLERQKRDWWAAMLLIFALVTAAFSIYLNFDYTGIIRDHLNVSAINQKTFFHSLINKSFGSLTQMALILGSFIFLGAGATRLEEPKRIAVFILLILIPGLGVVVCSGNMQWMEIPLFVLPPLLLLEIFQRDFPDRTTWSATLDARFLVGSLIALTMMSSFILPDAKSILAGSYYKLSGFARHNSLPLNSPVLADMYNLSTGQPDDEIKAALSENVDINSLERFGPHWYVMEVNTGLDLLRRHIRPDSRIFSLTYNNPFPFATQTTPPKGVPLVMHYGRMLSDEIHTDPEDIFADTTLVLVLKKEIAPTPSNNFYYRTYLPELERTFTKIDESNIWMLYERQKIE